MYQYKKRFQLKNIAKDRLTGKFPEAILLLLTFLGIYLALYLLLSFLVPFGGLLGTLLGWAVSLIFSVLVGVLNIGVALFYLNAACGQPISVANLFYGFREQPNRNLAVTAVICSLSFLFGLPSSVCLLLMQSAGLQALLVSSILDLVCQVLFLPLSLALSQSYYLLLDYPDLSAWEVLRMSCRKMSGHKLRLFLLQLSFLPLIVLACLSFFVGFLWLVPYMEMTYTLFFLDLMAPGRTYITH